MKRLFTVTWSVILAVCCSTPVLVRAESAKWIRAGVNADRPVWGLPDGIMVGIWPGAIEGKGKGGPRGLIRIGYPLGEPIQHRLVNFIAVEPDVGDGKWRGQSELEPSESDGQPGKQFEVHPPVGQAWGPSGAWYPGLPDHPPDNPKAERLRFCLAMEKFRNGAHPLLLVTLRSDRPDEVMIQVYHMPDSAVMRMCVLTATMGNFARLRVAHLAGGQTLDSKKIWPDYKGNDFAPFHEVPLKQLARTSDNGVIVPIECDEKDPASNWPYAPDLFWRWPYEKVTQYWRAAPGQFANDLAFAANARSVYWRTDLAIPGGVAFENTELRQAYRPGQAVCFGVTRRTPQELMEH